MTEANLDTRDMTTVLLEALESADRVAVETKNALGEMDAHFLHAPEVLQSLKAVVAERDALREALVNVTAYLIAAKYLLENGGKEAAWSDKVFEQMLLDYQKSIEEARAALKAQEGE